MRIIHHRQPHVPTMCHHPRYVLTIIGFSGVRALRCDSEGLTGHFHTVDWLTWDGRFVEIESREDYERPAHFVIGGNSCGISVLYDDDWVVGSRTAKGTKIWRRGRRCGKRVRHWRSSTRVEGRCGGGGGDSTKARRDCWFLMKLETSKTSSRCFI